MSQTPRILEGKVSVITGGGSGVGKAMAELFVKNGAKVVVVDVIPERVEQVISDLGEGAKGIVRDLSHKDEPEKMIDEAMNMFGRIDILCNNAGIMDLVKPVDETDDDLWQRVLDINLNSPFRASRRAIPIMLKQQNGGVITNTASVAGLFGGRAGAAYTVSKHALIGLTRSIAADYGGRGIRCNAMVLGAVSTNIGVGGAKPSSAGMEVMQKALATMPGPANPIEIAKLGLFLASSDSSYINGSCIVIDKGWTVV